MNIPMKENKNRPYSFTLLNIEVVNNIERPSNVTAVKNGLLYKLAWHKLKLRDLKQYVKFRILLKKIIFNIELYE